MNCIELILTWQQVAEIDLEWDNLGCNGEVSGENIGIPEYIEGGRDEEDAPTVLLKTIIDDMIDHRNGNSVLVPPAYDDNNDVDVEEFLIFILFDLLY